MTRMHDAGKYTRLYNFAWNCRNAPSEDPYDKESIPRQNLVYPFHLVLTQGTHESKVGLTYFLFSR